MKWRGGLDFEDGAPLYGIIHALQHSWEFYLFIDLIIGGGQKLKSTLCTVKRLATLFIF